MIDRTNTIKPRIPRVSKLILLKRSRSAKTINRVGNGRKKAAYEVGSIGVSKRLHP